MPKKILIIEDEKDIVTLLEYNLRREGYQTVSALDGEAGLAAFRKNKPDIVLLDLMLPKQDGFQVCRLIRQTSKIPILMLTARQEEVDRVLGLELGADDYVTKPFGMRELMARVKALLRRAGAGTGHENSASGGLLRAGKLKIDLSLFEARLNNKAIPLTTKEFELLRVLTQSRGKVFSRDQLLEAGWGTEKGTSLDTRTVDQHVARLRKKLGSEKNRLMTVKNRGYRFRMD